MPMSSISDIDGFLVFAGFDWKDTGTQPVSCHIPQPLMLLITDPEKSLSECSEYLIPKPKAHSLLEII